MNLHHGTPSRLVRQHFPQYVFCISPHHTVLPFQSSFVVFFGSLRHSRCPSYVFVPDLVFAGHSVAYIQSTIASSSRLPQSVFIVASLQHMVLSHIEMLNTPLHLFQLIQPDPTRFVISVFIPPSSSILLLFETSNSFQFLPLVSLQAGLTDSLFSCAPPRLPALDPPLYIYIIQYTVFSVLARCGPIEDST